MCVVGIGKSIHLVRPPPISPERPPPRFTSLLLFSSATNSCPTLFRSAEEEPNPRCWQKKERKRKYGPFFRPQYHNISFSAKLYVRVSVTKKKTLIGTGLLRLGWRKQRNRGKNDSCSTANTVSRKYAFQLYPTKNTPLYIFGFHYPKLFHETSGENEMSLVSSPPFSSLALSAVAQDKGGGEGTGGFFFRQGKGRERVVSRLSTSLGRRREKGGGRGNVLAKKRGKEGRGGGPLHRPKAS